LQHLRALNADAALAQRLNVPTGQAVLHISRVGYLETGQRGEVVLAATSFYPEGGGQVGDRGEIVTPTGRFRVDDTQRFGEVIVHAGAVLEGAVGTNEAARAVVDREWRLGSQRNHTATHLLHAALRSVLGTHVRQAGSFVGPDRLRFDYTHPEAPSTDELRAVQRLVNAKVRDDIRRETLELPYDAAIERGAIAFFEDRYTSTVRVVEYCELPREEGSGHHGDADGAHDHGAHADHQGHTAGCFSRELCGGTHLTSTGGVGILQVVSDSSIGAGLRRIEAVTGPEAERLIEERADLVGGLALRFKVPPSEVVGRIDALEEQLAEERRRLEQQRREANMARADRLMTGAGSVDLGSLTVSGSGNVNGPGPDSQVAPGLPSLTAAGSAAVVGGLVEVESSDDLRAMADRLRRLGSPVVVLGAVIDGRPSLLVAATDDAVERGVRADELVRAGAELIGGRGGGRPNLAQAGGRDASRLGEAIEAAKQLATTRLGQ
jgi:alanyl-tRNA synthetase